MAPEMFELEWFDDGCVTVHLWYSSLNNQLDATITID